MFNSPSSTVPSPLRNNELLTSQVIHFSQSPQDSRVPRTPSVACPNLSLDQSVPLTPNRQMALDSPFPVAFSTPNRMLALSDPDSPHSLHGFCSPSPQGISPRGRPHICDQQVPSTPSNPSKHKAVKSPLTEQPPISSPVSLVPCSRTMPEDQRLLQIVSPVQLSLPKVSTSPENKCSNSFDREILHRNETNHPSSSAKCELNGSWEFPSTSSLAGKNISKNQTEQVKQDVARKCAPPSRRRLSLGHKEQKDALRRTAHLNLALQRSLPGTVGEDNSGHITHSFLTTATQDNHQREVPMDDIFLSHDASVLFERSCESNSAETGAEKSQLSCGGHGLMSPAGDASNAHIDKRLDCYFLDINNPRTLLDMNTPQCTSTPMSSDNNEAKKGPRKKQSTILDLFDDDEDEIFG